ncbi:MAG: hypothetical protein E3K38_04665, partial [Candidatus Kuenenia stuttgartiensis]|nr:hypothetical protein [Candidatus Kuenenia stuttgartiensis]
MLGFLLLASESQASTNIDLADNVADVYIYHNVRNTETGHMGGLATGDVNKDGLEDLILSSHGKDVVRDEHVYLPSDQDSYSDDIKGWKVSGKGKDIQADTFAIDGNYSIKFTRKKSGSIKCQRNFDTSLALTGVDTLHFQLYMEDVGEKLRYIDILAPNNKNRFRYKFNSEINYNTWNQIGLNLSKFSIDKGSPDWNNVSKIVLKFKGGHSGNIRIDQLYFDHYELQY